MAPPEVQDIKTTVSIAPTKAVVRERLGMPILLNTTGGTAQLLSPNPQDKVHSLDGTGLLGLFTTPNKGGKDYWLVASWFWNQGQQYNNEVDPDIHTLVLNAHEYNFECRWMEHPVKMKSLWDCDRHRLVEVYVNKTTMTELFAPYGGPYESAKWLAGRLLPRRLPAVLRLLNGYHLQLWMKL